MDGRSEFKVDKLTPQGEQPELAPPIPQGHAQKEQMTTVQNVMIKVKDVRTRHAGKVPALSRGRNQHGRA